MSDSWIAKITENGKEICVKDFENERSAMAFIQSIADALKERCNMKLLQHTIHINESTVEIYPMRIPVTAKKRTVAILEAEFTDK